MVRWGRLAPNEQVGLPLGKLWLKIEKGWQTELRASGTSLSKQSVSDKNCEKELNQFLAIWSQSAFYWLSRAEALIPLSTALLFFNRIIIVFSLSKPRNVEIYLLPKTQPKTVPTCPTAKLTLIWTEYKFYFFMIIS
jgi:hypothetical protein